jgi:hypothetical protein
MLRMLIFVARRRVTGTRHAQHARRPVLILDFAAEIRTTHLANTGPAPFSAPVFCARFLRPLKRTGVGG